MNEAYQHNKVYWRADSVENAADLYVSNALHNYRLADGTLLSFKPIKERSRTYRYPDGSNYRVDNATLLCVRETSHRLVTADRKHIIVRGGFHAIEIDCDGWSA